MGSPPPGFDQIEGFAELAMCLVAGRALPALNDGVDIQGVEFGAVTSPVGTFGRQERRSAPQERVNDNIVAFGRIQDRVGDQQDRLHGGVQLQSLMREIICPRVVPDVSPIPPETAELDIVQMRFFAIPEDENKFMPRAVERSQSAIVFCPYADV